MSNKALIPYPNRTLNRDDSQALSRDDSQARDGTAPNIAIIDDDLNLVHAISRILHAHHACTVEKYSSVEGFLKELDANPEKNVSLILLDFHLPGQSGPKLVAELKKRRSPLLTNCYILGMTGDREKIVQNEFHDAGIEEIIQKPLQKFDYNKISKIAHAVNKHNADLAYHMDYDNDTVLHPNIIKRYI